MESKNGFELYANNVIIFCFLGTKLWKERQARDSFKGIQIQEGKNLTKKS